MCTLERQILVVDGGFSTQLSCNMEDQVDGTPLWTATVLASNPDAVIKTHLDFLRGTSMFSSCYVCIHHEHHICCVFQQVP
jgi:S-methylmethionine-dependent homocysteine/selenocysteine methylase